MSSGTFAEHRAAYREGRTTPLEVAERFLAAQPVGGPLDPFISVDPDRLLSEAAASTKRLADDVALGPLEGILAGIKDFFAVEGYVSRGGTSFLVEPADRDAELVARLRRAGAIIAGKNRTTELGLSPIGINASSGSPRNPHDPRRVTGGSSAGAGAAIGGGLVPLAVGTDGGGSVRIPPALCGIFGFKPTFGRIPSDGAMNVGWWSLDHPGPMTRCVDDLADAFAVLADTRRPSLDGGEGLRYGVDWHWWGVPDTSVDRACREAVAGLDLAEVHLDHLDLARIAEYLTIGAEVATAMHEELREGPSRFGPDVQANLQVAREISAVDYLRAQQVRTLLDWSFSAAFEQVDVLVCPTTACTAPQPPEEAWAEGILDETLLRKLTAYTFPGNLLGHPAVTVPVGTDDGGMPIGLMLTAARGRDDDVLRAAAWLEQEGIARLPRPRCWTDPLPGEGVTGTMTMQASAS